MSGQREAPARPEVTTTKGSARPEGGREAPALGGGSGAARFAGEPGGEESYAG